MNCEDFLPGTSLRASCTMSPSCGTTIGSEVSSVAKGMGKVKGIGSVMGTRMESVMVEPV